MNKERTNADWMLNPPQGVNELQAIEEAKKRGEEFFCGWCWNRTTYPGFWTDRLGNRWCKRCNPKEPQP